MDSCSSTPISKNETLPAGCAVNGTNATTVDVGECERVKCVNGNSSFNSSCTDASLCCGPRLYEKVLVQCGALLSFDLSTVKTCGCGKCIEKETVIEGTAVGEDSSAAKSVDVFFAGKSVDTTNADGRFSFVVPKDTRRAIVTFKDQTNKKFEEEDKVFILNKGQTVQYRVTLREKPKPIIFNASEPLLVPLGGESDSFADLELPENALLTEDGSVFNGSAKARVSVTDPRNQSDVSSAPGDFSATNEDGEEEILETFGMMKLDLEDDKGKPLSMSKPMKVYLDPEKLNISLSEGNVSIKLYWLDRKTGRWREAGDLFPEHGSKRRRRRSNRVFLAGTVTPSIAKQTLNLDTPSKRIGLRVSIFKRDNNALVRVICKNDQGQFKGYVEENTVDGVTCIAIWKDSTCYVQAEKNSQLKYYDADESLKDSFNSVKGVIEPVKKTSGVTITSFKFSSDDPGLQKPVPLYRIDRENEMKSCKAKHNVNAAKGSQFIFKPPSSENSALIQRYSMLSIDNAKDSDWSLSNNNDKKCFIRVNTATKDAVFMAVSYQKGRYKAGEEYGLHVRESIGNVVCLQFRCPGDTDQKRREATILLLTPMITQKAVTCNYDKMELFLKQIQDNQLLPCNNLEFSQAPSVANGQWLCIPYTDASVSSIYPTVEECETKKDGNKFYVDYKCR